MRHVAVAGRAPQAASGTPGCSSCASFEVHTARHSVRVAEWGTPARTLHASRTNLFRHPHKRCDDTSLHAADRDVARVRRQLDAAHTVIHEEMQEGRGRAAKGARHHAEGARGHSCRVGSRRYAKDAPQRIRFGSAYNRDRADGGPRCMPKVLGQRGTHLRVCVCVLCVRCVRLSACLVDRIPQIACRCAIGKLRVD